MADQIHNMLTGDVTDLPPKESNIVRIFTSSTFTDTFEERNKLMKDVYPSLRTYCQQHNLEFQVVDMRWGVRDEATADHKTTELCIEEIKTCKRLTPGPNYVCFLGNKYGYRPFPCKIHEEEFEILLDIARNNDGIKSEEIDLLLEWFIKDTNAIPAEYVLQPVTAKLLHYMDMREEVNELYKQEREQWWKIFTTFQRVLRIAAREAGNQGKLTPQIVHKYFKSVTEDEVEHGILNSPNASTQTLCYVREIEDIHVNLDSEKTPLYTDINDGEHDKEAQDHLDKLKRQRILDKLGEDNVTHYTVPWSREGINANDRRHHEYLQQFCDKFESDIHRLIDKSLDVMRDNKIDKSSLYKEVLHHSWFCRDKCASFRGRQDILDRVKCNICSSQLLKPLVVYGDSGSGKTSIMAVVVSKAKEWLGRNAVCVFRFLGTSPDSSNIVVSLTSIIQQIHEAYNLGPLKDEILEDYSQLVRHFHELLMSSEITAEKPLLLVIDSIDQLLPSYNAHLMNWLPKSLQPNVKVIISVLPGYYDIIPTLRRRLQDEECYIEVPSLTKETGHQILDAWLEACSRTLTDEQRELVMSAFEKCPQPLFLKLIFTETSQWTSYTDVSGVSLGASVKEAITLLFERIERKHGKVLVSHALGYITAARHGLTKSEIEDILSLDDDVIDDVYQYWDPPVEGVVRLPNLLWARIRHDIDEFFVERQADRKTIVTWYHRQFWESAELRYLSDRKERISRHTLMCEYFQGIWGGGTKKHITLTRRRKALPDADRQVPTQPLLFAKDIYNLRKLSELPYHFIRAENIQALKDEVLFNFEWINAKIHGQSLNDVLEDYDNALSDSHDVEIRLAKESLVLASSNIKHDSDSLAPQIIARMLAFKKHFPHIGTLIDHSYRWCYARSTPFFIPMSASLISAGGPLITNLRGHTQRVNAVAVTRDNQFIVTSGEDGLVNVWNQGGKGHNHDCLHTFKMSDKGTSFLALLSNDTYVAAAIGRELGVWDIDTGENLHRFKSDEAVTCLSVTPDGRHVVCGGGDGVIRVWGTYEGAEYKEIKGHDGPINSITFDVDGHVISASKDSTVRVWDLSSGESIQVFQGHTKPVLCLVVTVSGKTIVSGSEDKNIKIWDLESRDCVTLKGHTGLVKCLAAMHDGTRIVSGSKDELVKVWHLKSLKCLLTLKGHYDLIWALAVSRDDSVIVSASKDDLLKVWRADDGTCLQTLVGHSSWISCVAMTPDGDVIISGSNDKNIKLWNARGNDYGNDLPVPSTHYIHHKSQPLAVTMTTDGHWGVSGSRDNEIQLWDIGQQKCCHTLPGSANCATKAYSLPYVVTGSHNGTVTVRDCVTPKKELASFKGHVGSVTKVIVTSNDSYIISGGVDGTVRVRTIDDDGQEEKVLTGHTGPLTTMVALSDDRHILTGSKDTTIKLWNLNTAECGATFTGHKKDVACLVVTADCKTFVSGSTDFTIKIWSTDCEEEIHTIKEYNDSITDIVMTTDDSCFIAGSHESKLQLRMWDVTTGACVKVFHGHTHAIMKLMIAHAHNMLLSSSRDGTVKAWDIASANVLTSFDFQSQVKYFDFAPQGEGESNYWFIAVTRSGTVGILKLWNPQQACAVDVSKKDEVTEEEEGEDEDEDEERQRYNETLDNTAGSPTPSSITFSGNTGCCGKCTCCKCNLL